MENENEFDNDIENNEYDDESTEVNTSDVIRNMVDDILSDRGNDAVDRFNAVVSAKMVDAMDAKKQWIAQNLNRHAEYENETV
jgi:hypothetical protein